MKGQNMKRRTESMECPVCGKSYQSEKDLYRHCLQIHGKTLKELSALHRTLTISDIMEA